MAGLELSRTEATDRFIDVDPGSGYERKQRQNKDRVSTVQLVRVRIRSSQFHMANVADQLKELIHSSRPMVRLIQSRREF